MRLGVFIEVCKSLWDIIVLYLNVYVVVISIRFKIFFVLKEWWIYRYEKKVK